MGQERRTGGKGQGEGFKKLIAWQKAYRFAFDVYQASASFPKEEQFGLVSQMRRSAVSVPANIAEGYERSGRKDYLHFLRIAKGSLSETETYLLFSRDLHYLSTDRYEILETERSEVGRLLTGLIRSLAT